MAKLEVGINDLNTVNPELAKEWHPTKNGLLKPSDVLPGSNKKVWWRCKEGHEWESVIASRNAGRNCPFCSGQKVLEGFNDFKTWCMKNHKSILLQEWNYSRNVIQPAQIAPFTKIKVWWKCKNGHEWEASVCNRTNIGLNCPICSGQKILAGYNDLKTTNPEVLEFWDYSKNTIKPNQLSKGSNTKVWWKCKEGHVWEASIHNVVKGERCPVCSNKKIIAGINDFQTWCKENNKEYLLLEWDVEKNLIKPTDISYGSTKMVWWKCANGHSWETSANARVSNHNCPYCSNSLVLTGYNDLETWCKTQNQMQILEDWDYEKNNEIPSKIGFGSSKKIWFKCHICKCEWKTTVASRTGRHTDCPKCAKRTKSSFPEQAIYYYIAKSFPDAISGDRDALEGFELDIFIPSLQFAIEYDGKEWHKDIKKDLSKDCLCKDKGIILYRVRENGCQFLDSDNSITFSYNYKDWNSLSDIIRAILRDAGSNFSDVNISRDEYDIKEQYFKKSLENSLLNKYPEIAKEWHPTKNKKITPDLVFSTGYDKYWWLCPKCNIEYKTSISSRTRMGTGCPKCGNENRSLKQSTAIINLDTNEIFDSFGMAAEKYSITHSAISCCCRGITKTAGGYRWSYYKQGPHSDSTTNRSGIVKKGINDLETFCKQNNRLDLLEEWDKNQNDGITPSMVAYASNIKRWWICSKGHTWQKSPNARVLGGKNCPYCANQLVLRGYNDLETNSPELAKEWDYSKNALPPSEVLNGSHLQFWWKCDKGHSWKTAVDHRQRGSGCPYCANRKVIKGFNDLATTHPDLAKEWDFEKNKDLTPYSITYGSGKNVWWKCSKGHSFQSKINNRTSSKEGCPYCSGKKVLYGYNDFETWCKKNNQEMLLNEWCLEKNEKTPKEVTVRSHIKIWWKCSFCGKEWNSSISTRTRHLNTFGCKQCSVKQPKNKK